MTGEGQVCDRCRRKKVKCDGASDPDASCSNCAAAGAKCEVTARLRRKTKFRGYAGRNDVQATLDRLENENAQLRRQLHHSKEMYRTPQQEDDPANAQGAPRASSAMAWSGNDAPGRKNWDTDASLPEQSEASTSRRSAAFVIKHMGRMVHDHSNVGRFAGSTTGVHFLASVEELCRRTRPHLQVFPEACFRIHINESSVPRVEDDFVTGFGSGRESITASLDRPREYYLSRLDAFNDKWIAFCPLIPRDMFIVSLDHALHSIRSGAVLDKRALCSIGAILAIMLITELTPGMEQKEYPDISLSAHYLKLMRELYQPMTDQGDLSSLQTLILFSFYFQITNQTSRFVQMNGSLVRLAQSLGMHRHARRFRFTDSENEFRKRMWWWIYSFDQYTSVIHGLPRLIQDTDVDNDLPIDCELHDLGSTGLQHPLPGEPTPVFIYIRFIQLTKILSLILSLLYTTTQRREGEEKIVNLDRELRGWYQNLTSALRLSSMLETTETTASKSRLQRFLDTEKLMIAWLDLMANYALVLIHRPALTFDQSSRCFRESLHVAVKASNAILRLASSSTYHRKALDCAPFGPAVVFQSALMRVFNSCLGEFGVLSAEMEAAQTTVREAIQLLQDMLDRSSTNPSSQKESLESAFALLSTLMAEFLVPTEPQPVNSHLMAPLLPTTSVSGARDFGLTPSSIPFPRFHAGEQLGVDYWNTSSLQGLNHLDIFAADWDGLDFFGSDIH